MGSENSSVGVIRKRRRVSIKEKPGDKISHGCHHGTIGLMKHVAGSGECTKVGLGSAKM